LRSVTSNFTGNAEFGVLYRITVWVFRIVCYTLAGLGFLCGGFRRLRAARFTDGYSHYRPLRGDKPVYVEVSPLKAKQTGCERQIAERDACLTAYKDFWKKASGNYRKKIRMPVSISRVGAYEVEVTDAAGAVVAVYLITVQ